MVQSGAPRGHEIATGWGSHNSNISRTWTYGRYIELVSGIINEVMTGGAPPCVIIHCNSLKKMMVLLLIVQSGAPPVMWTLVYNPTN